MEKKYVLFIFFFYAIHLFAGAQMKFHAPVNEATPAFVVKTFKLSTGVQLNYAEQGEASNIPIVFLHGFTDSWRSFEQVLTLLPSSVHAFAVSVRGHGDSDKPTGTYNAPDFSGDIALFIKELNIGPVVIVGHSMGASIAQRFALDHPELTKALVLVGSFASFEDKPAIVELGNAVSELQDPVDTVFISDFQKSTLSKDIPASELNKYITESSKLPARVWKATMKGLLGADYRSELKKINIPTLIIWGEKDTLVPEADQDKLLTGIKTSRLLIYKDIGHAVHWEEPVRFANDLLNFINKHL